LDTSLSKCDFLRESCNLMRYVVLFQVD
jgi:hypothetical protein